MKRLKLMAEKLLILLKAEVDALMKPIVSRKPGTSPDHLIRYQTLDPSKDFYRRMSKYEVGENAIMNAIGRLSCIDDTVKLVGAQLKSDIRKRK